MEILKRVGLPLFLVLMICAVSVFFYVDEEAVTATLAQQNERQTIIIDAGHEALENTIKHLKIIAKQMLNFDPKTRLNSGFLSFLYKLISRNKINLQILKFQLNIVKKSNCILKSK